MNLDILTGKTQAHLVVDEYSKTLVHYKTLRPIVLTLVGLHLKDTI
jgi:hypothetical protein